MSKKKATTYNKSKRTTLTATALKAKKDNLQKQFDDLKKRAKHEEQIRDQANTNLSQILSKMAGLQASWKTLEELEEESGLSAKKK